MMNLGATEVEAIVQAVVRRLQSSAAAPTSSNTALQVSTPLPAKPASSPPGRLKILDRVVTLASLRPLTLQNVTEIEIPSKSIITPAVRDELKLKGIAILREVSSSAVQQFKSALVAPAALCLTLANDVEASATDHNKAKHALELAHAGYHVVWATHQPFAAQAAMAGSAAVALTLPTLSSLTQALQEAAPKVLIVDTSSWNAAAIRNLLGSWKTVVGRSGR